MPSAPTPDTIAALLERWRSGDAEALDGLMDVLYAELRALAHAHMRRERSEHTLQTSALINEPLLTPCPAAAPAHRNRAQFFGIAAHMMRRILVDYARSRAFQKRGSGLRPIPLDDAVVFSPQRSAELLALDEALDRLGTIDGRKARVVELRYFGGMTATETANALGVSESTVMRDWEFARAWLSQELRR